MDSVLSWVILCGVVWYTIIKIGINFANTHKKTEYKKIKFY